MGWGGGGGVVCRADGSRRSIGLGRCLYCRPSGPARPSGEAGASWPARFLPGACPAPSRVAAPDWTPASGELRPARPRPPALPFSSPISLYFSFHQPLFPLPSASISPSISIYFSFRQPLSRRLPHAERRGPAPVRLSVRQRSLAPPTDASTCLLLSCACTEKAGLCRAFPSHLLARRRLHPSTRRPSRSSRGQGTAGPSGRPGGWGRWARRARRASPEGESPASHRRRCATPNARCAFFAFRIERPSAGPFCEAGWSYP